MEIATKSLLPKGWETKEINDNLIKVSYKTKGRGNSPKPLALPKRLILDKEFVEGVSLYIGDGKLSGDKNHLDFTSKDKDLVKFILDFFVYSLNLSIEHMRFTLTYKRYSGNSINQWLNFLRLPHQKLNLKQSNRHNKDCFGMQIGSVILRNIFGKIIEKILEYDFSNDKTLRRAFLRGLFAAEGGIAINNGLFDLCSRKKRSFIDKCKKTKFYFRINKDFKDDLFSVDDLSQRQLAFKIKTTPSTVCILRKEKDPYFESKLLTSLCRLKDISFDELKKQIVSVRVNKTTSIKDEKLVEFVLLMSEKLLSQSSRPWLLTG